MASPEVPKHIHNWRHLGGAAFGMYRCDAGPDGCLAIGYSKVYRGANLNQKIVPYSCEVCGAWAVAHDFIPSKTWKILTHRGGRKQWRCKNHRADAIKNASFSVETGTGPTTDGSDK